MTEQLAAMPRYKAYKNSNVDWIGEIPEHWEVKKLKYLVHSKTGFAFPSERFSDEGIPLIRIGDLKSNGRVELSGCPRLPEYYQSYLKEFGINNGEILMAMTGGTIGKVAEFLDTGQALLNQRVCSFSVKEDICRNLALHWSKTRYWQDYIDLNSVGGAQPNISDKQVLELPIAISLNRLEQTTIANFLDQKTTQIDQAIAIKEKQITLLKERKQILIQNAVTRGLNPDAPMRDSGVEWIGEIPAHWEVKRLKYLGSSIIGLTYNPNDLCDNNEGNLVLRSSNLYEGKFKYGEKENVYVKSRIPEKLIIRKHDILICSRNGSRELIGKCAIASQEDEGYSFGAFTTVFRSDMNTYLFRILNSDIFKMLSGMFLTSTINQLTIGNLNSIKVPLPPKPEREQINKHIKKETEIIDKAIAIQEQQIEKLKEYKTTLINSAVTGKIKVI